MKKNLNVALLALGAIFIGTTMYNKTYNAGQINKAKDDWPAEWAQGLSKNEIAGYKDKLSLALQDIEKANPDEISYALTPIVPWNKDLIWNKDKSRVLMVSWVPEWVINSHYPKEIKDSTSYKKFGIWKEGNDPVKIIADNLGLIWVAPVHEVRSFVTHYEQIKQPKLPLWLRITQLYGLRDIEEDSARKRYFVEMWVKLEDLVRPCPDTDILDKECTLDEFQEGDKTFDLMELLNTADEYKKWFENQKLEAYKADRKLPWTRLGYTYDWGDEKHHEDKKRHEDRGLSEFILKKGASIIIHRVIRGDKYANILDKADSVSNVSKLIKFFSRR